jgi:hypothetical protein
VHSDSYRTSALNPITWLCGEESSLGPHNLIATQQANGVILFNEFVRQLPSIEHHGWQLIMAPDESWFYLSAGHEHI